jgi:hypothetical protein
MNQKKYVYAMTNGITTFDVEDIINSDQIWKMKELEKQELEKQNELEKQKFIDSLNRDNSFTESYFVGYKKNLDEIRDKNIKKTPPSKNNFYKNQCFRSEEPPNPYKLSGELTSFDNGEIQQNQSLTNRLYRDYLESQRNECISKLSDKDLKKKPFIKMESIIETTGNFETPKPPPKWIEYKDKDGDTYYYNIVTKVTKWEKPTNL